LVTVLFLDEVGAEAHPMAYIQDRLEGVASMCGDGVCCLVAPAAAMTDASTILTNPLIFSPRI